MAKVWDNIEDHKDVFKNSQNDTQTCIMNA